MTETAGGSGAAFNATVVAVNDIPALEAALVAARQRAKDNEPRRILAAAEAKVEKLRAHVAAAEAEVARLLAELED